ncbi:MAG TPA: PPOX class F420-dependent oxidoreductase [Kineosporiaceae bacterium]|nr:PPOX class F420-dependent oxidoreductase [Kineosporiaceae bacterium]
MDIPDDFHSLLSSTAVAVISTIGRNGEPQATPTWFMFEADRLKFSLVDGRQKLINLRRDARVSVLVIDPARPTYYVELRGRVALIDDPEAALERAVSTKYTGDWADGESPGTMRYAAILDVERVTSQKGHVTPATGG